MVAGMTVANLIGVPLGSFLSWAVTWRLAFMIVAAVAALVFIGIKLWIPALPALPDYGFSAQFRFLTHLTPWLVLGAIGFGNGGFFAYYSYVNPIMENLASVPASLMSAVITLAGFGMVCGNLWPPNYRDASVMLPWPVSVKRFSVARLSFYFSAHS